MLNWGDFAREAPDVAGAGMALLETNEVAMLATVSSAGRPRIHPFVPKIVGNRFVAFIMDSSPKVKDLQLRRQYAIHAIPGFEDEEFCLSGEAIQCNDELRLREESADAMGFATGVDSHHLLFEFKFDRALWTRWLDFGKPEHRPQYNKWKLVT